MNRYKSFIKDNMMLTMANLLVYAKGLIMMPLLIKNVGVIIYGGYGLVMSVLSFIFGISTFGADYRFKRLLPATKVPAESAKIFYPQFFFHLLVLSVMSVIAVMIAFIYKSDLIAASLGFSIILIPLYFCALMVYSQAADYFRYSNRIKYLAWAIFLNQYIAIGLIVIMFLMDIEIQITHLIMAHVLSSAFIALPLMVKMLGEIRFGFFFHKFAKLAADIRLGIPLTIGYVLDFILVGSDRYIIAGYLSVKEVGFYTAAYGIGSLIVFFPKLTGGVLPQFIARAVDTGNKHEADKALGYTLKLYLLLGIPFIAGSLVMGKSLLILFANEEVAVNAHLVIPIVAAGILFYGLAQILRNIFFANMKTMIMLKMDVIAAVTNLVLNLILLYIFRNILVAAFTTLISYVIMFIFSYRKAVSDWGTLDIPFNIPLVLQIILASAVMGSCTFYLNSLFPISILGIIITILASVLIYISCILLFGAVKKSELTNIYRIVLSKQ